MRQYLFAILLVSVGILIGILVLTFWVKVENFATSDGMVGVFTGISVSIFTFTLCWLIFQYTKTNAVNSVNETISSLIIDTFPTVSKNRSKLVLLIDSLLTFKLIAIFFSIIISFIGLIISALLGTVYLEQNSIIKQQNKIIADSYENEAIRWHIKVLSESKDDLTTLIELNLLKEYGAKAASAAPTVLQLAKDSALKNNRKIYSLARETLRSISNRYYLSITDALVEFPDIPSLSVEESILREHSIKNNLQIEMQSYRNRETEVIPYQPLILDENHE